MQMDDRVRVTGGMYMGQTGVLITGEITTVGQVGEIGRDALGYWVVDLDNGGTVMLTDDVLEVIE